MLDRHGVGFYFGGTLFEKFALQGQFEDFRRFCEDYGASHVEASNGTIDMSNTEKAGYIRKLAGDFEVVSEVGFKDSGKSEMQPPSEWIAAHHRGPRRRRLAGDAGGQGERQLRHLPAGRRAPLRPARGHPARRRRRSTSCSSRRPTRQLQAHLITRIGPDVNLGNVPAAGVIGLETLRLGLRSDTLTVFEGR